MLAITREEIQKIFGSTIYSRGTAYFNSNLIVELELQEVSDERVRMTSIVVNENGKRYFQEIVIKKKFGMLLINSKCNCLYGEMCKHSVAVLLNYISEYQNEFEIEPPLKKFNTISVQEVIQEFKEIGVTTLSKLNEKKDSFEEGLNNGEKLKNGYLKHEKNSHDITGECHINYDQEKLEISKSKELVRKEQLDQFLNKIEMNRERVSDDNGISIIYELDMDFGRAFYLKPYLSKKKIKSGLYNIGKETNFITLNYQMDKSILSISDNNIIDMGQQASQNVRGLKIQGKIGYLFIEETVKTGKLFYQKNRIPLRWSENKSKLEFQWKKVKSGYKFVPSIPVDSLIIPTQPLLKIELREGIVYEIESNLSLEEWETLSDIQSVSEEELSYIHYRLEKLFPTESIEYPKVIKKEEVNQKLHVKIKISCVDGQSAVENILSVFFCYGNHQFKNRSEVAKILVEENGKILHVNRDIHGEKAVFHHLFSLQFEQISKEHSKFRFPITLKSYDVCYLWDKFLNHDVEVLESLGYEVVFDKSFTLAFEEVENIYVDTTKLDWFSLQFSLEVEGKRENLLPMVASILEQYDLSSGDELIDLLPEKLYLETEKGRYCKVKKNDISPILKTILQLYGREKIGKCIEILPSEAHLLDKLNYEAVVWKGNKEILEISEKLKSFEKIEVVEPPKALTVELRTYQKYGLNWLNFLYEYRFSGILADDMGLGKTIQTLAHLSRLKEIGKLHSPSLIIVPTSLVSNWKQEILKFTPNLNYIILHGKDREIGFETIHNFDLVITTYSLIMRDEVRYFEHEFEYIILDEAQKIKNSSTKMGGTIRKLRSNHRLALSGTPIENHLGELWSIFHFLMPGFLKSRERFNKEFRKSIEQLGDKEVQKRLNQKIAPFILRRTKEVVAKELPEKSIIVKMTQFEKGQAKLYEGVRLALEKRVRDVISEKGAAKSQIVVLDALLKLRQICCHPHLLKIEEAHKVSHSAKFELFKDLIEELVEEKRKILVFSQFTEMISILETYIKENHYTYSKLIGSTIDREREIEKFKRNESQIFLISLKAGGVGLNLTEADSVIHYDPWWNPAVENQATDRTHRIGQDKKVFVYKLIIEESIESKILELQERKKMIQEGLFDSENQNTIEKLNGDELLDLLTDKNY